MEQIDKEFIDNIQSNERIIHKVINLYIDHEEDKKDCFQEIMIQSWKSYPTFLGKSTFGTWLYKISLNTVLNFHKKHERKIEIGALNIPPENKPKEKNELLYLLIKQLDDIDKLIITMHLDGYKNSEIKDLTGMKINHVNVKLHRIKKNIIESYKKLENGPL